jgi:serine/threonine protein kinase
LPVAVKEFFFRDYCLREAGKADVVVHSSTGQVLFAKFKEKLLQEARILSSVQHRYIVGVLEVFEENNTAYIVMEYIEGLSLRQKLEKEGPLPEYKALQYIRQTGQALDFVHHRHVVHMDVKPSNILIDKEDNARLIDFGVSKRLDDVVKDSTTTTLALSKGFAPIEHYDPEEASIVTPSSDIYSLGATLYYLLTGRTPVESILRATRPLVNPLELNPAISAATAEVIMRAMEIDAGRRFVTVKQMLNALPAAPAPLKQNPADPAKKKMQFKKAKEEWTMLNPPAPLDSEQQRRRVYMMMSCSIGVVLVLFVLLYPVSSSRPLDSSAEPAQDAPFTSAVVLEEEKKEEIPLREEQRNETQSDKPEKPVVPEVVGKPAAESVSMYAGNYYEVKNITLGSLTVVKKHPINLYGAIDTQGNERIPCKYLYNDKVPEGRAFARGDGRFDIYNDQGVLVEEGVTAY